MSNPASPASPKRSDKFDELVKTIRNLAIDSQELIESRIKLLPNSTPDERKLGLSVSSVDLKL